MIRTKKSKRSWLIIVGVQLVFLLGLSCLGCKKKAEVPVVPPPAPKPVQPKAAVQKQVSSSKPALALLPQVDSTAKKAPKDPFRPYVEIKKVTAESKQSLKPVLPIYSFDLAQFQLIGVVVDRTDSKGNRAMVKDPTGKGYVLRVGMKIGKNESVIERIDNSGVHIAVVYLDDNNSKQKKTETISLRKP